MQLFVDAMDSGKIYGSVPVTQLLSGVFVEPCNLKRGFIRSVSCQITKMNLRLLFKNIQGPY